MVSFQAVILRDHSDTYFVGGTVATAFNPIGAARDAKKAKAVSDARHAARVRQHQQGDSAVDESSLKSGERFILHSLNGMVKSGEMCLVVGR